MTSTHFLVKRTSLCLPYAFLDGDQHYHLSRVLRARPGKRIWLLDERGGRYLAEVQELAREKTKLLVLEKHEPEESKIRLSLAQAILKSKKMDFLVQKSTELGVASFVPIVAARSVVKLGAEEKKLQRWQRIAGEAAKQSRRTSVPLIFAPQSFQAFLQGFEAERKFILCEGGSPLLREILTERLPGPGQERVPAVAIVVGPEGGWTAEEESLALASGFEAVSLGAHVLRSETAALAALSLISHFWNT